MKSLSILARAAFNSPPENWRESLYQKIGNPSRRMGEWAAAGFLGATHCVSNASLETPRSADDLLVLTSRFGTLLPTREALAQSLQDGIPMPVTFLQTQPTQVLAALVAYLNWQGNALFLPGAGLLPALRFSAAQSCTAARILVGEVETHPQDFLSRWLLLNVHEKTGATGNPLDEAGLFDSDLDAVLVSPQGVWRQQNG